MHLSFLAILPTLFLLASSGQLPLNSKEQSPLVSPLDSGTKVPGQSPLEFCPPSPFGDLVTFKYVKLTPNPPVAGQNLTIDGEATLKAPIEEGAYAQVEVKYGLLKLLDVTVDLCENAVKVDLQCPIEKGDVAIHKVVRLPSQIPPVYPLLLLLPVPALRSICWKS
jgi:hypothetical protein